MSDQMDFENDQYFLQHVVNDTRSDYIASIIKQRFDTIIAYKAIDFKSNVIKILNECQSKHGIPMFRTRYANQPFRGNSVLMVCYGSHDGRMKGVWFKDVPDDDLKLLAEKTDGYQHMLRKYSTSTGEKIMGYRPDYGIYGRGRTTRDQERVATLQELKSEIEKAIPDEQDAQKMYEKMTTLARNLGLNEKATEIDLIRGQESNHERIFRDMLMDIQRNNIR